MQTVDLFMFMGQSNMAGRGIVSDAWPEGAPGVPEGWAYEFRAVSSPEQLYELKEPFGVQENRVSGINDVFSDGTLAKTGSMVAAFCNAYYEKLQVPIVAVSASKGGSHIGQWQLESPEGYLPDALERYHAAVNFLMKSGYTIRHRYMVWCQGESDGDRQTTSEEYRILFQQLWKNFAPLVEACFLIRIGDCNIPGEEEKYREIQDAQMALCNGEHIVCVSQILKEMQKRGLMKDAFHYYQQGYNECGREAGVRAAEYVLKRDVG